MKGVRRWLAFALALCAASAPAADLTIFADRLDANWANCTWDSTIGLDNATPRFGGAASIAVRVDRAWGALYLRAGAPVDVSGHHQLRFWVHGGSAGGQRLRVVVNKLDAFTFTPTANSWTLVAIPFAA